MLFVCSSCGSSLLVWENPQEHKNAKCLQCGKIGLPNFVCVKTQLQQQKELEGGE